MKKITRRQALLDTGAIAAASMLFPAGARSEEPWKNFDDLYIPPSWHPQGPRVIEPAPAEIVTGGRLRLGVFDQPCRNMNLIDARVLKGRERRWWGGPKALEWIGFGLSHPDWYFGMIIIDLKSITYATLYALDRKTGKSFSHDAIASSKNSAVAQTTWSGRTYLTAKGFHLEFIHDLDHGRHRIVIDMAANKDKPAVKMDLDLVQDLASFDPLVVSFPIQPHHFTYTHKAVTSVAGAASVDGSEFTYQKDRDWTAMDEFRSYWPLPQRWTWGTAVGTGPSGESIALNLVDYYTSGQQWWNENCFWIDGRLSLLGPVTWTLDKRDPMRPWLLREQSGRVEVTFVPEAGKDVDLGALGFEYYQKCGRYEGFVIDDQGERREFRDFYGVAENGRIG